MADPLADLSNRGVSIWLDDLSRQRQVSGSLADLAANQHVVGVTANPAIFAKAITGRRDPEPGEQRPGRIRRSLEGAGRPAPPPVTAADKTH